MSAQDVLYICLHKTYYTYVCTRRIIHMSAQDVLYICLHKTYYTYVCTRRIIHMSAQDVLYICLHKREICSYDRYSDWTGTLTFTKPQLCLQGEWKTLLRKLRFLLDASVQFLLMYIAYIALAV